MAKEKNIALDKINESVLELLAGQIGLVDGPGANIYEIVFSLQHAAEEQIRCAEAELECAVDAGKDSFELDCAQEAYDYWKKVARKLDAALIAVRKG